jgi:hypothetical protein
VTSAVIGRKDEHQAIIGEIGEQPDQAGGADGRRAEQGQRQHRISAACFRYQERRASHREAAETTNDKRMRPAEFTTLDKSKGQSSKGDDGEHLSDNVQASIGCP